MAAGERAAGQKTDLAGRARQEIIDLHDFFALWFRPPAEATDRLDLARCRTALAPDFRQIAPDGQSHPRAMLLQRLEAARGSRPAGFTIEIEDIRLIWQNAEAVLLDYVERQYCREPSKAGAASGETRRRATAFFTLSMAAPNGVVWRHLQETWLQAPAI
ncbi:MAG TPA: hypothetical protein VM659_11575 [Dongiaceae bacterium]|nr:hypothetical protein [Dongiaceae bacterium]